MQSFTDLVYSIEKFKNVMLSFCDFVNCCPYSIAFNFCVFDKIICVECTIYCFVPFR